MTNAIANVTTTKNCFSQGVPKLKKEHVQELFEKYPPALNKEDAWKIGITPTNEKDFKEGLIYKAGKSIFDYLKENKKEILNGTLFGIAGKEKSQGLTKALGGGLLGLGGMGLIDIMQDNKDALLLGAYEGALDEVAQNPFIDSALGATDEIIQWGEENADWINEQVKN